MAASMPVTPITKQNSAASLYALFVIGDSLQPNAAHQWRAANDARYETDAQSARLLNALGSASFESSSLMHMHNPRRTTRKHTDKERCSISKQRRDQCPPPTDPDKAAPLKVW